MMTNENKNLSISDRQIVTRESGIELLKILAMFLIVISHIVSTLTNENAYLSYSNYVLDITNATNDIQHFALTLLKYFGAWGNTIFFICSAWFLLRSESFNKKKELYMFLDIWFVSIVILVITYLGLNGNISRKLLFKSLFPTLFANNWYLTCYLLFYPIHPLLNKLIRQLNKQALLRLSSTMFIIYCCFSFIKIDCFYSSPLIVWITIYFVMAYIQLYMSDFNKDIKKNVFLFLVGMAGYIGLAILTNTMGLHFSFLEGKMLYWVQNNNPFLIAMTIAMFNIMRNIHFKSKLINYISSLTILIYLIHDNLILRSYLRPYFINLVYVTFGYDKILIWVILIALGIFIFSILSAVVYDKTLRKIVKRVSISLYYMLCKIYQRIETVALRLH